MIVGKEIYSLSALPQGVRRTLFSSLCAAMSVVALASFGAYGTFGSATAHAGGTLNVWWPTNGAHVTGLQPFKAMVEGSAVEQYDMYWQVDGGSLVQMTNSYTDYPHKEAPVDVSSWKWHGSGPYVVHFVAKQGDSVIAETSEDIYVDNGLPTQSSQSSQPVVLTMAATAPASTTPALVAPTLTFAPTSTPTPAPAAQSVETVWWPTSSATLNGMQPFKAVVNGMNADQYDMYWQVDNGSLVLMQDNATGGTHKEAIVDVSGWTWHGSGPYYLNFVAKDKSGKTIAQQQVIVNVGHASAPQQSVAAPVASVSFSAPLISISSNNPLSGSKLYVNPNTDAATQAQGWASSRPSDSTAMRLLANQPTAAWFGNWNSNIGSDVRSLVSAASAQGQVPVMVAYDIPQRDCSGGYSAGGGTPDQYRSWVGAMADAIGNSKAVVILEPDALADLSCLSSGDQQTRLSLLSQAVSTLKSHANTVVYLDAGHSGWIAPSAMAANLRQAGVSHADGFAVNVSNFDTTDASQGYGEQVSQLLGGAHYVIDTSRNGNGSDGEWCNPSGRAIGPRPTAQTGNAHVDAYLWLKTPGESDGNCNGGPSAGTWWPDYALQLVHNAGL